MRRVLIITYYWPPSGGVGVQRWLKFSKYLPSNNWLPIIYTPDNPDFNLKDETLDNEVPNDVLVLKQPIWEPFQFYNKLFGKKGASTRQGIVKEGKKESILEKISIWIRGNLFLPDARRYWVRPSVKYLTKYISENDIDLIVTTGPPHSLHLIGLALKKRLGIKWVADFRDPWSQWDVLPRLKTSSFAMRIHQRLENKVAHNCDLLLTVSPRLGRLYADKCDRVKVITNGFDFEPKPSPEPPNKFRITHAGLFNETKNVQVFWKVLEDLCAQSKEFKDDLEINLAGNVSTSILEYFSQSILSPCVLNLGYMSHSEVFDLYRKSYVLMFFLNQSDSAPFLLPAKLFEYFQVGKLILGIGPLESDANDALTELSLDPLIEYEDYEGIKSRIMDYYSKYKQATVIPTTVGIEKYSRQALTDDLAQTFDQIVQTNS